MVDRVVSLAPSATNTIRAIGAGDRLVGRTTHGEGPGEPIGGWLTPDLDAIDELDADLVVTIDDLQAAIASDVAERGHRSVHFEPRTLADVLDMVRRLGSALGLAQEATSLARDLKERIDAISASVADRPAPVVYCEEWQEPPMVAGNWVPEAVTAAGGRYPFLDPGERSRRIDRASVESIDPDVVVLHVCGRGIDVDPRSVADRGWDLQAVDSGRVVVVADSLLNQPSPRLVDGIDQLRTHLHPEVGTQGDGR